MSMELKLVDRTQFKHIRVSEDDDIVIQAGIRSDASSSDAADDAANITDLEDETEYELDDDLSADDSVGPDDVHVEPRPSKSEVLSSSSDEYHETTLQDIQSSKMSNMQKVILLIAVLAIAAFAIYTIVSG